MTQVIEPMQVPAPPEGHDNTCPFCKQKERDKQTSKIGKHNSSGELENNLAAEGEARHTLGFEHEDYGKYSGEPHHLVPGKEALMSHPIERWLSKDVSGSHVNDDTGFDINSAKNGIWLPSIPDQNRICKWETKRVRVGKKIKKRRVPMTSEKDKKRWSELTGREKDLISFAIMLTSQRQFHKGNHQNKGKKPSECYVKEVKRLLNEIDDYVAGAIDVDCPEAREDSSNKFPPPLGINQLIYGYASGHMRWHVVGQPESWFVFISALARRLYQEAIDEGKTPWSIPYPGHPDRS